MVVTALAFYLSTSFTSLLFATIFCGLGTGMSNPPSYALLSEISLIRFRGGFASIHAMNSNAGWIFAIGVGALVTFDVLPWLLVIPSFLALCLIWFLVESPLWFLTKYRKLEAVETLEWLRGPEYDLEQELKELEDALMTEKTSILDLLRSGARPVLIILLMMFFQTSSGSDTVSIYSLIIFSHLKISEHAFSLMFQGTITIGYLISPLLMLKMNRKPLLIMSTIVMSMGMILLGSTAYLPSNLQAVTPMIGVILAGLGYGTGVGPLPFILMTEVFPQKMKSAGLAIALSAKSLFTFCHIKAFPWFRTLLGISGIFYFHASLLIISLVFSFLFVPETRNKSVKQLEQIFKKEEPRSEEHSLSEC